MDLTSVSPGPEGLRALSHPGRLRLLGLLRTEGPATATMLATRLGLNSGATSYHLRQLAQHGFIEDDPGRGNARDRWWRAAHRATRTDPSAADTPEQQDTVDAFLQAVAVVYTQSLQAAVEERRTLPAAWQEAGTFSDWELRLTPDRATELKDAIEALVEGYEEDADDTPGAQTFVVNLNTFLRPGSGLPASAAATAGTGGAAGDLEGSDWAETASGGPKIRRFGAKPQPPDPSGEPS